MSDANPVPESKPGISPEERQALDRVLSRIARNAGAMEQSIELVEHLAGSGTLAALNAILQDFDENFSAITRPEFMGMVANLMMLLGVMSQVSYEPFFDSAMNVPAAVNRTYPEFRTSQEKLGLREMFTLLRSPEVAAALRMMVAVLRAQRGSPVAMGERS